MRTQRRDCLAWHLLKSRLPSDSIETNRLRSNEHHTHRIVLCSNTRGGYERSHKS
jgi:hypothetical protein